MRSLLVVVFACLLTLTTQAQINGQSETPTKPCSGPEYRQLDFWVGQWRVSWGTGDQAASGTNTISVSHDGCVLEEDFDGGKSLPLKGTSLSIYDARSQKWRQTWVDNQGGHFSLIGGPQPNGDFILRTVPVDGNGGTLRMVFSDITQDSLTWDWQATSDGGKTWVSRWTIRYERIGSDDDAS